MNLKYSFQLLDGRWRGPLINTCTDLPQPSCAAAEQTLRCSDVTHGVPPEVVRTQKPYPSWEIPELGVMGIWHRYLGTEGLYCWMRLYWGCCWIPWSLSRATWWTAGVCVLQEPWFEITPCQEMMWVALNGLSKGIEGHLFCSLQLGNSSSEWPSFCLASITKFVNISNAFLQDSWSLSHLPVCASNTRGSKTGTSVL